MEVKAVAKNIRISPRKMRLVRDGLSGKSIEEALRIVSLVEKRGAGVFGKLIKSAISNAIVNKQAKEESLMIQSIEVNEGQAFKRFRPSTRGRTHPYKKRGSIVTVIVTDTKGGIAISK